MTKKKIIIDCDPGIDDAFALVLALKEPLFEIVGIHTVAGNVSVEHTTRNTRGLCYLMNKDIPIHQGSSVPLVFPSIFADDVHGKNGFSGYQFADHELAPLSPLSSLEGYARALRETEEKLTIIALGPLTNLGILFKAYPHLIAKIECISLMGGGIKGGNITSAGEFNFYVDPHSADIVFNSKIPIIMAGLDVTEKARLYPEDMAEIKAKSQGIGAFLEAISRPSFQFMSEHGHGISIAPNDAVAVLYLSDPTLFTGKDLAVSIACDDGLTRGMSVADVRLRSQASANAHVLFDVDCDQFRNVLIRKITGGSDE